MAQRVGQLGSGDGNDTIVDQRNQDLLAGNEGMDTLGNAMAVIDDPSVLTTLEA